MSNSVKLLNYVDPDGDYIKFYTSLNSDFNIGEKVFIVGGHYDNTSIAKYDPYHKYAAGYSVVAVDKTNLSNSVTLNILNTDEDFLNSDDATIFAVYNPYYSTKELQYLQTLKDKSEEDLTDDDKILLQRENFTKEAWISKSIFKVGEFNGGTFEDGIFGEYNINENIYNTYFNRKYENKNAVLLGGVVVGGNWQYGEWDSRYEQTKYGKIQELNEFGGITDPLNSSNLLISEFNDNNVGQGWNIAVSGNFGRIWNGQLKILFNNVNNQLQFEYIPLDLRRALINNISIQIDVNVAYLENDNIIRNSGMYTIQYDPLDQNHIDLLDLNILNVYEIVYESTVYEQLICNINITVADPEQIVILDKSELTELYKIAKANNNYVEYYEYINNIKFKNIKNISSTIHNIFSTGEFLECDIYNGLLYNNTSWKTSNIYGGNWFNGEVKYGKLSSVYSKLIWHNGIVNGSTYKTILSDIIWNNGTFLNGVWEGARRYSVKSLIKLFNGTTNIELDSIWDANIEVGDNILLSYFKSSNSTLYLENWTQEIDKTLLEYQTFIIKSKVVDYSNRRLLLNIDLDLTKLGNTSFVINIYNEYALDLNYQYSRISNSAFNKGVWIDGTWNTGYLNGLINKIYYFIFDQNNQTELGIVTNNINNLKLGDYIELTNVKIIHLFDFVDLLPGTNLDDRNLVEYWQNVDQLLRIKDIDIDNNIIYLDLTNLINDIDSNSTIIGVSEYYENSITGWSYSIWEDGIFNSGVIENTVWKNGIIKNVFIEDSSNTQIKTIWRSGVWKNGEWDNGVFLSGIWENGDWMNGYMTNGWNRSDIFWTHKNSWQISDSIWMNGTWHDGRWIRGMWNKGIFINGLIENAGIDQIEIIDGTYSNGRTDKDDNPVFTTELNINRSFNSAPSIVFMDQNGLIQLDQSSWYQRDYNVIFKDLNFPLDGFPWNDQMFDVLSRNKYGSELSVDIEGYIESSTSLDICNDDETTKDVSQDAINKSLPFVVVRNIVNFIEIENNKYWIADGSGFVLKEYEQSGNIIYDYEKDPNDAARNRVVNGYNRILEIDVNSFKIEFKLVQKVLNDPTSPNIIYDNIIKIITDVDSEYVYVLENTKIIKIHKVTYESTIIITHDDLKSRFNLQTWYDFAIFPARVNIPETIFVFGLFINGIFENFDILSIYPLNGNIVENITYKLPEYKGIFNSWITPLKNNNYDFTHVIFKGYSELTNYIMYEKLPIDITSNGVTYHSNDLQRQTLIYDVNVTSNNWTLDGFTNDICPSLVNSWDSTSALYDFKDYIVTAPINNETVWFLMSDRKNIYYNNNEKSLTHLVADFGVSLKSINNSTNNILAVFNDNISPIIIPKYTKRLGFGISSEIDSGNVVDENQYSQRTMSYILNNIPDSSNLKYWLWDYLTKRLINVDQQLQTLYTPETEYGVEPPIINKILFLSKTTNNSNMLFIDELTNYRTINVMNINDKSINPCCQGLNVLNSLNLSYDFINASYNDNKLVILYSFYDNNNNVTEYNYDVINLSTLYKYSISNISTLISPSKIAITNEEFYENSVQYYKTYIIDSKNILNNEQSVIISSDNKYIFISETDEIVEHICTYSENDYQYMYVVTKRDAVYNVFRLTKHKLNNVSDWPSNLNTSVTGSIILKSDAIIYTTDKQILNIKAFIQNENFKGVELLTDDEFIVLENDYTSFKIKEIQQYVDNGLNKYYAFDSTNRIIELIEDSSTSGVISLVESKHFGQYMQPLQYGSYIRNATSLYHIQWNGIPSGNFMIFVDYKLEETILNNTITAISKVKKYVRIINIDQYYSNQSDVDIITIFDGDDTNFTIKDPWGNIIYSNSGTSSSASTSGYLNATEVIDVWAQTDITNANYAIIYFMLKDLITDEYLLVKMHTDSQGNTTIEIENNVASNIIDIKGFTMSMIETDVNSKTAYVYTDNKIYQLDVADYSVAHLRSVLQNTFIDELIVTPTSTSQTRIDYIFINAIIETNTTPLSNRITNVQLDNIIQSLNDIILSDNNSRFHNASISNNITLYNMLLQHVYQYNFNISDVSKIIKELKKLILDRQTSINTTNNFNNVYDISDVTIQLLNQITTDYLDIFGVTYDTHLYSAISTYSTTNYPILEILDDNDDNNFRSMQHLRLSKDRNKLLITGLNNLVVYEFNYTSVPANEMTYNLINTYLVEKGEEIYNTSIISTTKLPAFKTAFDTTPIFNSYYKEIEINENNNITYQLYSPFLSGRVLKNMIWRDGNWNTGEDTRNLGFTAFLISSKWLSGEFTGSWHTSDYFNHTVIDAPSLFIGGIFGNNANNDVISSTWHNGIFLGGIWVDGSFNKGHLISDNQINVHSISFSDYPDNNIVINQVYNASYDVNLDLFKLDIEHYYNDIMTDSFKYNQIDSKLVRHGLIFIPGLFQSWKLKIYEIRKVKYQISGYNEIVLITDIPLFDIPDNWLNDNYNWLNDNYIYIMGVLEYTEFLHGEHYVSDSFTYNNKMWITIRSDFNKFNEYGIYTINQVELPYITLEPIKIKCIAKYSNKSSIMFSVPTPLYEDDQTKLSFLKQNIVSSSLDVIDDVNAENAGTVVSTDRAQVFDRSAIGTSSTLELNSVNIINTMYFNNINNINYIGSNDISDLVIVNSTLNSVSNTSAKLINSLIYSGNINININACGWLNYDEIGFCNADSNFYGNNFNGGYSRIINYYIEDNQEYLWIELEKNIENVNIFQYIYLRGFSGNKANVIGSSFSQPFRIQDISSNLIKIRNPFKLYSSNNIIYDKKYKIKFSKSNLNVFKQTMLLEPTYPYTFYYTYASNAAWNGGTFYGSDVVLSEFKSIWNGGSFAPKTNSSKFIGEFFGRPHSHYYTDLIYVKVQQDDVNFKLIIDLVDNDITYNEYDLIYVEFKGNIPLPFYDRVKNGTLSHSYASFYPEGYYIVQLTRYRAALLKDNFEQLILDYNLLIGPEKDYKYDLLLEKSTYDYSNNNTILNFKLKQSSTPEGITNINLKYLLKSLTTQNIIFDMYLNLDDVTTEQVILNFQSSYYAESVRVVLVPELKSDLNKSGVQIRRQYNYSSDESVAPIYYSIVEHEMDNDWHHLYVAYDFYNKKLKVVFDAVDILDYDNISNIYNTNNNNWKYIASSTYSSTYMRLSIYKGKISNIILGKGNEYSINSYQGKVDNIRFWNTLLNDGSDGGINEIEYVKNKRFMSYNVKQIDAKISFDDRYNEFINSLDQNVIQLFSVEYINEISLPSNFIVYFRFKIDHITGNIDLLRFNSDLNENSQDYKISVYASYAYDNIQVTDNNTYIKNIDYSKYYELYISGNQLVILDQNVIMYQGPLSNNANISNLKFISVGNKFNNTSSNSAISISSMIIYNDNGDSELFNNLINNNLSNFTNEYIDKHINKDNYKLYSDNYYIVDPPTSLYSTIINSTDPNNSGSVLVELIDDYVNWEYLVGDDIFTSVATNSNGDNLELWGTNGEQHLDYYDAEIFDLYPNGEPVWKFENVSFKSQFNNGKYISSIWRSGILNGGSIENNKFIWKWGINNGGNILDTP